MKNYNHIRNAIFGQPWAIQEQTLDLLASIAEERAEGEIRAYAAQEKKEASKDWSMIGNVAVISVSGPIARHMNLFSRISGGASLDQLGQAFTEALESDAATILFHMDSPGGTVLGTPELASRIYDARENSDKQIIAFADGNMCSAAYWLGSQCQAIYLTEASVIGSIGVIARLSSADRMEKNAGVDSVVLRSHELKAIGNGPITPNQMSALQAQLMQFFEMFKQAVVRGRPQVNIEEVATGLTFIGQNAVDMKLADEVATFDSLIARYS